MDPTLFTLVVMIVVAVGGALILHFAAQIEDASVRSIVKIGVIAIVIIILLVLLWRLAVRSGVASVIDSAMVALV